MRSVKRRARLLEDEFVADSGDSAARPLSVALAINNDTLATWLLPGLAEFLIREHILLDIMLDDQDHTYSMLSQGLALAGVSSHALPMRGCEVHLLGAMRYRLVASPSFAQKWFPDGLQRAAARVASLMVFDRKVYPSHYMPASEAFAHAVWLRLGYGMVPELQYGTDLEQGALVDLAPDKPTDVRLYWHSWRVQSPKLERLSAQVVAAARSVLLQPGAA